MSSIDVTALGVFLCLASALSFSLNRVYLNTITQFISPLNNVFYVGIATLALAALFSSITEEKISWSSFESQNLIRYFYMCLNGLGAFGFQFFMIKALDLEKDTTIANLLINTQILFSWVIDVIVYRSDIDAMKLFGAIVVVSSSTYMLLLKS